jgi:predicted unusual protein kinase regulating ubiquinone biosynthesis (AarF/ABC1/UbiB family)
VIIPAVEWSHTTRRVLTLEDVSAIKIGDYDAITAAGVDRAEVARRLFDTYLEQIFEDGFFHADPHPGNLFVFPATDDGGWRLAFIDFGMVGRVPDNLREGLREAAIAVATQDGGRLVRSYQLLGALLPGADVALLEKASSRAFSEFWGRSMGELRKIGPREMHRFVGEFRELMYNMPFQVPQDLIWLGRTVAILSGMCTGLDPDFNLWTNLEPYARKLVAEETTGGGLNYWLGELGTLAQGLIGLPRQTGAVLSKMERGDLTVNVPDIASRVERLEGAVRNMMGGVMFAAMLLGGVQLILANQQPLGDVLLGGSALALIWVIAAGRKRS